MSLDQIRLSEKAKDQLVKLKRYSGIKNWNILCRWAFCVSLAESTRPAPSQIPSDSNVEMSWRVFGGAHEELYLALLKERCQKEGIPLTPSALNRQFRLHLHRGIGYLSADRDLRSIARFVSQSVS